MDKRNLSYILTEKDLMEFIRVKIRLDFRWAMSAARLLYSNTCRIPNIRDGVGFNRIDGPRIRRVMRLYGEGSLCHTYALRLLSRILPKYIKQIYNNSNHKKLLKQAEKYYMINPKRLYNKDK